MRNAIHTCLIAAVVLALATDARAQSASSLTGTVKDTSGGALPGATVTVVNPTQAVTQAAQTDPQGVFLNLTTNVANAAGQTGAAIFNSYTGLTATSNVRPAGDTRQLGTFFGEVNAARDPRIVQLGIKLYF